MNGEGMAPSVLVLDDEQEWADKWAEAVRQGMTGAGLSSENVRARSGDDLDRLMQALYDRGRAFRDHPDRRPNPDADELDACDVLIIDSDLREVMLASGQDLAYSARCFTDVGCIAILNADGEDPFDLTLVGNRRAFADVHLGSLQLNNPGLWRWPADAGFRPWHWPILHDEARRQRARVERLIDAPDVFEQPVVSMLGLNEAEVQAVPRAAAAFLTARRESSTSRLADISVRDFVLNSEYALKRRDAAAASSRGLVHVRTMARVGAARLAKWVNAVLVPGQDVMTDAPHLVVRFPSCASTEDRDGLNRTIALSEEADSPAGLIKQLGLLDRDGVLAGALLDDSIWTSRPLWWGRRLAASDLPEAQEPWNFKPLDLVFCEDESRFRPAADAQAFACDVDTPFRIRHYFGYPDVVYRPPDNLVDF